MPELPEVETVRLGLEPAMVNKRIARVELRRGDLRRPFPPAFARRIAGRKVAALRRRAKYLVAELEGGLALVMHLGMSGSFRIEAGGKGETPGRFHHPRNADAAHDHVVFRMSDGTRIVYNDPRRFGLMDLLTDAALEAAFAGVGIEPLSGALTAQFLAGRFQKRQTSIKAALLDQGMIAGLGNIYVCEALWLAGISPLRIAADLAPAGRPTPALKRLAAAIPKVLEAAIAAGGSSLRNHARTDGRLGEFQHAFHVYDREGQPCHKPRCRGTVRRIVQNGRSTFYCPVCQN
ncbi:MAG: bifunctional DNA-formamidopyrimidine glycosylase/DNA-(apurinic or apyrimidinic site) lyase [Bauldia sp.]|nr:bifunctional DNA-formamidopyrimidine glycosylase/DNA-(apurinic or apyrimidinic site) lyase [Bauldia sp.]